MDHTTRRIAAEYDLEQAHHTAHRVSRAAFAMAVFGGLLLGLNDAESLPQQVAVPVAAGTLLSTFVAGSTVGQARRKNRRILQEYDQSSGGLHGSDGDHGRNDSATTTWEFLRQGGATNSFVVRYTSGCMLELGSFMAGVAIDEAGTPAMEQGMPVFAAAYIVGGAALAASHQEWISSSHAASLRQLDSVDAAHGMRND